MAIRVARERGCKWGMAPGFVTAFRRQQFPLEPRRELAAAMRGSPLPPCGLSCFSSCAGAGLRFACSDSATRRSTRDNFSQRTQQPVHFLYGVVVEEPDAQKPPVLFDVQLFGEVQRVIVAIPREEAACTQLGRQFEWRVSLNAHRDGWTAVIKTLRIADTVELQSRKFSQAVDQALAK